MVHPVLFLEMNLKSFHRIIAVCIQSNCDCAVADTCRFIQHKKTDIVDVLRVPENVD